MEKKKVMFVDDPKHINQKKFFLSTPKIILAGIKAIREKRGHYCKKMLFIIIHTVSAQIEQRCSNFCPRFFAAVLFKFGKSAVIIKMLL